MLHSVPHALEALLSLAAAHEPFAEALLRRRADVAASAGLTLNDAERVLLASISDEALRLQIAALRHRQPLLRRRRFLRQAVAALLTLSVGATASACDDGMEELQPSDRRSGTLGHTVFRRQLGEVLYTTPREATLDGELARKRIQLHVAALKGVDLARLKLIKTSAASQGQTLVAAFLTGKPAPTTHGGYAVVTLGIGRLGTVKTVDIRTRWVHGPTVEYGIHRTFSELQFAPTAKRSYLKFELTFRVVD